MRPLHLVALLFSALLAASLSGCGGSSHARSTSSVTVSTSTRRPVSAKTATSASTQTRTASVPPETTTTGASGVRLPATFAIRAQGALAPATVTAPSGVPVQLTVISEDGKPHRVVLQTPQPRALSVPAEGRAQATLTGLAKGQYPLQVDGATKGSLVIGGQPGP